MGSPEPLASPQLGRWSSCGHGNSRADMHGAERSVGRWSLGAGALPAGALGRSGAGACCPFGGRASHAGMDSPPPLRGATSGGMSIPPLWPRARRLPKLAASGRTRRSLIPKATCPQPAFGRREPPTRTEPDRTGPNRPGWTVRHVRKVGVRRHCSIAEQHGARHSLSGRCPAQTFSSPESLTPSGMRQDGPSHASHRGDAAVAPNWIQSAPPPHTHIPDALHRFRPKPRLAAAMHALSSLFQRPSAL